MHQIILVDMDGVLTDLLSKWLQAYNKDYDDALTIEEFGIEFGGIHKVVKPECGEKIYEYFGKEGFVTDLVSLPGAVEGFKELVANPKFDTYICSAFGGEEECVRGKIQWLKNNCPFFDTKKAIFCTNKYLVHGDVLLDDGVEKLTDWQDFQDIYREGSGRQVLPVVMTAPHNFEDDTIPTRVNNFQEFNELLKVIF